MAATLFSPCHPHHRQVATNRERHVVPHFLATYQSISLNGIFPPKYLMVKKNQKQHVFLPRYSSRSLRLARFPFNNVSLFGIWAQTPPIYGCRYMVCITAHSSAHDAMFPTLKYRLAPLALSRFWEINTADHEPINTFFVPWHASPPLFGWTWNHGGVFWPPSWSTLRVIPSPPPPHPRKSLRPSNLWAPLGSLSCVRVECSLL